MSSIPVDQAHTITSRGISRLMRELAKVLAAFRRARCVCGKNGKTSYNRGGRRQIRKNRPMTLTSRTNRQDAKHATNIKFAEIIQRQLRCYRWLACALNDSTRNREADATWSQFAGVALPDIIHSAGAAKRHAAADISCLSYRILKEVVKLSQHRHYSFFR